MKFLVDAVQMLVVTALIYPMFYIWDTTQVDQFCSVVESGMSKQEFIQLVDDKSVKIIDPMNEVSSGKWHSSIVARSPFTNYSCEIVGLGNIVSRAWILG
ncbi:MAG: hypothetical protein GQ548_02045 [Methylophaga sp.]|nr:hypothetical protein [Methylophaga sp.]